MEKESQESIPQDCVPITSTQDCVPISDSNQEEIAVRKSKRPSKSPSYLKDYHCDLVHTVTTSPHHLSQVLSYDNLNPTYKAFTLAISSIFELVFYHEYVKHKEWRAAMSEEFKALKDNQTWSIVPLPKGKKAIGCRWQYKNKFHSDGTLARRKARLVENGYTQQEGLDYTETFSPVAKLVTIKMLCSG